MRDIQCYEHEAQEGVIYPPNVVFVIDNYPNHCFSVVTNPVKRTAVYIGVVYCCPIITLLFKCLKCYASLNSEKQC